MPRRSSPFPLPCMAQSVARGSPTAGLPAWISPQLAQLVDAAPGGDPMAPRDQIRRLPHACGAPAIEQPAFFQVLNEKRKLAQRRHRRPLARLPFHVNPARKRVGDHRPINFA
jgi:hypothetical protein